jgi:hypothetical protein
MNFAELEVGRSGFSLIQLIRSLFILIDTENKLEGRQGFVNATFAAVYSASAEPGLAMVQDRAFPKRNNSDFSCLV